MAATKRKPTIETPEVAELLDLVARIVERVANAHGPVARGPRGNGRGGSK